MNITPSMTLKQKASFSTTMEVMKHRKALTALVLNPEFRHQNKAIILMVSSSFPSKIQIGTLWLYLEQQQDAKGESKVWKHTKHHKMIFFIIKPCVPIQLDFETLYANYL